MKCLFIAVKSKFSTICFLPFKVCVRLFLVYATPYASFYILYLYWNELPDCLDIEEENPRTSGRMYFCICTKFMSL